MTDKVPKYIEGIGWRYETDHSMSRRMKDHDYQSRCIYMLTLTLANRKNPILGRLEWKPQPLSSQPQPLSSQSQPLSSQSQPLSSQPQPSSSQSQPSSSQSQPLSSQSQPLSSQSQPLSSQAQPLSSQSQPLSSQPQPSSSQSQPLSSQPQPLSSQVLVRCSSAATFSPSSLGEKVASEWDKLCLAYPQLRIIRLQLMPDHLHVVLFVRERIPKHLGKLVGILKNNSNKHYWQQLTAQGLLGPKGTASPPSLFSENYQDTILAHEGQLEAMIKYVEDNPYRALIKRENPKLFKVVSELKVGNVTYAAIGNRWLLDQGVRMQVRCHNNTSPANLQLIARQKEYFLERGEKGGVVVSPCISTGEKEIARAALDAGHPLIVLLENGFAPLYKPPGKYFEACAKGLLLMLAPWPYHMEKRTITRSQCLALNSMAQAISNEPWTQDLEDMLSREG